MTTDTEEFAHFAESINFDPDAPDDATQTLNMRQLRELYQRFRTMSKLAYVRGWNGCSDAFKVGANIVPNEYAHTEPDIALLASMATCINHGFGALPSRWQKTQLDDMRKVYEEVVGIGWYRPETRERYIDWLDKSLGGRREIDPPEPTIWGKNEQ